VRSDHINDVGVVSYGEFVLFVVVIVVIVGGVVVVDYGGRACDAIHRKRLAFSLV
jgi:hypothetical protein